MDKGNKKVKVVCFECKKRLKLMEQIKCNCDNHFCPKHLNRHSHNCSFDVKKQVKMQNFINDAKTCQCGGNLEFLRERLN